MYTRYIPRGDWASFLAGISARYRGLMVNLEQVDTDLFIIDPNLDASVAVTIRPLREIALENDGVVIQISDAAGTPRDHFIPRLERIRVTERDDGHVETLEFDTADHLRTTMRLPQVPQKIAV